MIHDYGIAKVYCEYLASIRSYTSEIYPTMRDGWCQVVCDTIPIFCMGGTEVRSTSYRLDRMDDTWIAVYCIVHPRTVTLMNMPTCRACTTWYMRRPLTRARRTWAPLRFWRSLAVWHTSYCSATTPSHTCKSDLHSDSPRQPCPPRWTILRSR